MKNSKTCIAIANIDNYDEIIKTALPGERLDLITQVEKELFDWAKNSGGLIIKTDTDTFVFIFEQQYLSQFEKDKFDIINKIKELDTEAQVTLSMAVSNEGNSVYEKYKSALKALDIVLGRGGDQVIVRKDGKYKFYGGTTVEVEKRGIKGILQYWPMSKKYSLLEGSLISVIDTSCSKGAKKLRQQLINNPEFCKREGNLIRVIQSINIPVETGRPSFPAEIITGTSMQGTTALVNKDGKTFADLYPGK